MVIQRLEVTETELLGERVEDALRLALLLYIEHDHVVLIRAALRGEVYSVAALGKEVTVHYQFHLLLRSLEVPRVANKVGDLSAALLHGTRLVIGDGTVLDRRASLDHRSEDGETRHFDWLPLLAQHCLDVLYGPVPHLVEHLVSSLLNA